MFDKLLIYFRKNQQYNQNPKSFNQIIDILLERT